MTTGVDPTPLIMLYVQKGSMVQAQYCSEWTELWYGTLHGSIPLFQDDRTRVASFSSFSSIYYWLTSNVCKSDTSGSRLKVPFAVTRHIYFISFHFISFHFISFHFISFHFISFHFILFYFILFYFILFWLGHDFIKILNLSVIQCNFWYFDNNHHLYRNSFAKNM